MTVTTKQRIEKIKARYDSHPSEKGAILWPDSEWIIDQLIKALPKPRKRRKAKGIPKGPSIKARENKRAFDIAECLKGREYKPGDTPSYFLGNGRGSCVDVAQWRKNLQTILDRPNPEITPAIEALGASEYFKGGPSFEGDLHKRAASIIGCLPGGAV